MSDPIRFVIVDDGELKIVDGTLGKLHVISFADIPNYFHMESESISYRATNIDDQILEHLVQLAKNTKLVMTSVIPVTIKIHNVLQSKMHGTQVHWTPSYDVQPGSVVQYSINESNYLDFPYDIAERIDLINVTPEIRDQVYSQIIPNKYKFVAAIWTEQFPSEIESETLRLYGVAGQAIPDILRRSRARIIIFYRITGEIPAIDGEISDTITTLSPHISDGLQRMLEIRRERYRFARVKPIMN